MSENLIVSLGDNLHEPRFMDHPEVNFLLMLGLVSGGFFTWLWLFKSLIS